MTKLRVLIATPLRRWPEDTKEQGKLVPFIAAALRELAERTDPAFREQADKYEFEFIVAVGGLARARNTLVYQAIKDGFEFILWIDSDLAIVADDILRLLSHRQPIVGGLYCKREKGKRPVWACSWIALASTNDDRKKDGLLQVSELATGFTCIHRKVFLELGRIFGDEAEAAKRPSINYRDRDSGDPVYGFYQMQVINGDLLSEDYFFCFLLRCAGVIIIADTKIKLRQVELDETGKVAALYPDGSFPPIPAEDSGV